MTASDQSCSFRGLAVRSVSQISSRNRLADIGATPSSFACHPIRMPEEIVDGCGDDFLRSRNHAVQDAWKFASATVMQRMVLR